MTASIIGYSLIEFLVLGAVNSGPPFRLRLDTERLIESFPLEKS